MAYMHPTVGAVIFDMDGLMVDSEHLQSQSFEKILAEGIEIMPGLTELLQDLADHRAKMAIASSSPLKHIRMVLDHTGVEEYFSAIVSGNDVKRTKPHPDLFLLAAKKLGVNPSECVVLEDAPSGIEAARRANMKVIAVPNHHMEEGDFDKADLIIQSLVELDWETILKELGT